MTGLRVILQAYLNREAGLDKARLRWSEAQ
jgi:hypothetical protein